MGEIVPIGSARSRRHSDEKLLTKRQMADDIGVHPSTLDRYAREGLIPFELMRVSHRGTKHRRYRRSEVRAALGLPTG
jgi:predicted site-specific integrase-resolvase